MIKAMLFLLLAQNSDGQIMYANGFPIESCQATSIQELLKQLPQTPRGMRMEYICMEPGPTKITADEQGN